MSVKSGWPKKLSVISLIFIQPFAKQRDICAVTLSRFSGEKGASISAQKFFLDDSLARHLPILGD
jgi:hypothetical protein